METDLTAFTWPQACPGQSCLTWVSCYGVGGGGGGGAGPDALGHPYSSGGIKIMPSLSKCLQSAGYHDVPLLHVHGHPGDVQSPSEGVTALLHVRTPRRKTCLRARDTSCGGGRSPLPFSSRPPGTGRRGLTLGKDERGRDLPGRLSKTNFRTGPAACRGQGLGRRPHAGGEVCSALRGRRTSFPRSGLSPGPERREPACVP